MNSHPSRINPMIQTRLMIQVVESLVHIGVDFFHQQLKLSYALKIGYGRVKSYVVLLMMMMYIPMKTKSELRDDIQMSMNEVLKEINGYRRCSELVIYFWTCYFIFVILDLSYFAFVMLDLSL
ncbi:uncharacterized protein LOC111893491 isoform X2 [Lactuca sativa]|uniref:uncharacterized protein LOC111893491 isoform X2 n=1 Tax=Lactuca sativa TaxID=4236 RepID=UPI000CD88242|nr:uncharacterized protein LOC111893491 isoform X2 [Lactuca sativa]